MDENKEIPVYMGTPTGAISFEGMRPMVEWDKRDDPVLLLVDYSDGHHPLEDAQYAITIGHNNDHNLPEAEAEGWAFAGWCWTHDHYTEGKGTPIGWAPLPALTHIVACGANDDN